MRNVYLYNWDLEDGDAPLLFLVCLFSMYGYGAWTSSFICLVFIWSGIIVIHMRIVVSVQDFEP